MSIELRGIAYLGLSVPDVDAWSEFATDVIGLMQARMTPEQDPGSADASGAAAVSQGSASASAYLKADDRVWRIALHAADQPGLAYAGFEVRDERSFAAAVEHLRTAGCDPVPGTAAEIAQRCVRDLVWVRDPSGVRVEVCWGPTRDGGFRSPVGVPAFVTGALGLGHYVLLVADLDAAMAFYQRVLGLRLSDYVVIGPGMSVQFLRCTPRHHSVALTAVGPVEGLHHIALEVPDVDQVGRALDRALGAKVPITASLGRHKNDRMLSFYMRSPAGFEVEIGCDGLVVDDATWVVNHFTGGDEWGHHGLTGEAMAATIARAE
jgi:2,3-dihydroxybiphenyl 1,2-dioxygenase